MTENNGQSSPSSLDDRVKTVLREAVYILLHPGDSKPGGQRPYSTIILRGSPQVGQMADYLTRELEQAMRTAEPLRLPQHFPHDVIRPRQVALSRHVVVQGERGYEIHPPNGSHSTVDTGSLMIVEDPNSLMGARTGNDLYTIDVGKYSLP